MPVRIRVSRKPKTSRWALSPRGRYVALCCFAALLAVTVAVTIWVCFVYQKYAKLIDEKLARGPFPNSSLLYSAPETVGLGDAMGPLSVANRLRQSGYGEDARSNPAGWFHLRSGAIEVFPGDSSPTASEPALLKFNADKLSSITALSDNTSRREYTFDPQPLSALYDKNREKRRLVHYKDIPQVLVNALVSIEDKRFFQHSGFDPVRIAKAAWVDLREHRNAQGASTLTQQLARMLWLDPRKTYGRKFDELLITIHLERTLSKQQILEYYANQVPLGQRGSFAIRGFGQASETYFGKAVNQLTLPEAATLAGLIQEPSFRNPARWPERAKARRNVVLAQMLDNGYISRSQYEQAVASPMAVVKQGASSAGAPYFVDFVSERLTEEFGDRDFQSSGSKIYTSLDPLLQRDAVEAVAEGMREVDALIAKRRKKGGPLESPQVALVCLDPQTGEIKALVGGRDYGQSQLDHALAKRPSGSIFKPFVYAAALNTGLWQDNGSATTDSSIFQDEPQTFLFAGKPYEPVDFHKSAWLGPVTLRVAFAKSLNVPAVEVAEQTGYGAVAQLAHKAGLADIRATPAMALGAYSVTPVEIAGAYTLFANGGTEVKPRAITRVVDSSGKQIWTGAPITRKVLDPRVTFLTVNLMQEVLRSGTGADVRLRGFTLPAAGKTGTSHDAWFAGFTSKLLCVVWVGLDDYQDIKLEGAKAALPVWTDFMKRAHRHAAYRNVADFSIPDGIVSAQIDADSGQLATSACPRVVTGYYLNGTQPTQFCTFHLGGSTEMAGWNTAPLPSAPPPAGFSQPDASLLGSKNAKSRKSGLMDKIKSIFK